MNMLEITTVTSMPGHWPREFHDDMNMSNSLSYPRLNTQLGRSSLQVPRIVSSASSSSSADELFFDCPAPNSSNDDEASSPSYLVFTPVVSTVSEQEPTDWRRYEPPTELMDSQDNVSEVVRGILEPSITRLRARHIEEEERRAANARRERPLARVGRASVKPKREVTSSSRRETNLADVIQPVMSGGLDPLQQDSSCMSVGSATSLLSDRSDDSGYASTSSDVNSSSPKSGNKRSFGLASFFRRKERSLHELHSGATSISTRSVTPLLEETPEAEPTTG
jgi:hypothetical protein